MSIEIGKDTFIFQQSHIDQSVWVTVKGRITPEGVGEPDREPGTGNFTKVAGYVTVYVGDFLLIAPDAVLDKLRAVIGVHVEDHQQPDPQLWARFQCGTPFCTEHGAAGRLLLGPGSLLPGLAPEVRHDGMQNARSARRRRRR